MSNDNSKVAIVTGASGGIGREISKLFGKNDISVVACYYNDKISVNEVISSIVESGGNASSFQLDVTKSDNVLELFEFTMKEYGRVDILVNNAGTVIPSSVNDTNRQMYDTIFNTNVFGALEMMRVAQKYLNDGGRIVNTSSTLVKCPIEGTALYAASKAALEILSRVLSKELGNRHISVNSIRVGPTIPGMFSKAPKDRQEAMAKLSPFNRLGTPKDIAKVVLFLVSDDSSWITGQEITIDGGAI